MDARKYQQIRQLFDAVQAEPDPERREALLCQAPEIRVAVERLIQASERGTGVFEKPPVVATQQPVEQRWEAGRRLGPYELIRELGEGGMGVVYLARRADGAFEKQVAIKIVRQNLSTPQFLARFQREREILAKLEHPHIARLLDGGTSPSGLAYLVMEYVDGEPLIDYADSRHLSYDRRLLLLRQVAEAVDYAHDQGIIHRDLKPSNIFVGKDGAVKLLDFGIASWQQHSTPQEPEVAATIALSPAYASPEQARGERTTKATDIYSFAMVAYELLAGALPFDLQGASLEQVLRAVREAPPKPASVAVEESADPATIGHARDIAPSALMDRLTRTADVPLLHALAKRHEDRPSTAIEVANRLAEPPGTSQDPARAETAPPWFRAVNRFAQWFLPAALLLGICVFLVLSGEVVVKPFAWAMLAGVALVAVIHRSSILKPSASNLVFLLLALLVFAPAIWGATHPDSPSRLRFLANAGGLVLVGRVIWSATAYVRREKTLGAIRISSKAGVDRGQFVIYSLFSVNYLFSFASKGAWDDLLIFFLNLSALSLLVLPLEVRRRGVVFRGTIVAWSEIESYEWLGGPQIAFYVHRRILPTRPSALKMEIQYDDIPAVQRQLRRWLKENPSANRPAILDDSE